MNRRGAYLLESSLGLLLAGAMVMGIIGLGGPMMARARQEKAVKDMRSITDAAMSYWTVNGIWPAALKDLNGYFPVIPVTSPWGDAYRLSSDLVAVRVSVLMPGQFLLGTSSMAMNIKPLGTGNDVSLTRSLSYGQTAWLLARTAHAVKK